MPGTIRSILADTLAAIALFGLFWAGCVITP